MSVIIIPHKHLSLPQGRVAVDGNNHAGSNALTALTFDGVVHDAVTGGPVAVGGSPVYSVGSAGRGLLATGGYKLTLPANPVQLQKQEVTYFAVVHSSGGGNNGMVFGRWMGSSLPSVGLGVHNGSFNGWWAAVNGTTSDLLAGPAVNIGAEATKRLAVLVLTVGGGVANLYVDGDFVYSGTYAGSIDYSRTDIGLFIFGSSGDISLFRGMLYCAGIIDGAMPSAAASDFSANPWQLFRADPVRIYSFPSGPISLSWSSLTASNITQTGARLTLGGITR